MDCKLSQFQAIFQALGYAGVWMLHTASCTTANMSCAPQQPMVSGPAASDMA